MRASHRRSLSFAIPLAFVVASALPAAALVAGPGPATTVQSVSLSARDVTATGAQVRLVTVSVHLSDPAGVRRKVAYTSVERAVGCPCVDVERLRSGIGADSDARTVVLTRSEGAETDGVWSGSFPVSAQDSGTWAVQALVAGTIDTREQGFPDGPSWVGLRDVLSAPSPTLRVVGRTPLVLTAQARRLRKNTLRITGTARIGRRASADLLLNVGALQCGDIEGPGGLVRRVRTNRTGTFSIVVSSPALAIELGVCVTYGPTGSALQNAVSVSAGA